MGAPIGNRNAYKGGLKHFHGKGSALKNMSMQRRKAKAKMQYASLRSVVIKKVGKKTYRQLHPRTRV